MNNHLLVLLRLVMGMLFGMSLVKGQSQSIPIQSYTSEFTNNSALFTAIDDLKSVYINWSNPTKEELDQLFFLTPDQKQCILQHISNTGPLRSFDELQNYPQFPSEILDYLIQNLGLNPEWYSPLLIKNTTHILLRLEYSPQSSKGIKNKKYLGIPLRYALNFKHKNKNNTSVGFTIDKDKGEPFFLNKSRTQWSHWSGFIQKQLDSKWLRSVLIGDFHLSTGSGMLFGGNFHTGISYDPVLNSQTLQKGIRPHTGLSEFGFYRGIGISAKVKTASVALLASRKPLDASLDQAGVFNKPSLIGLHRTPTEIAKKNNISASTYGFHLQLPLHPKSTIGFNYVYNHYSHPFYLNTISQRMQKKQQVYSLYGNYLHKGNYFFWEIMRQNNPVSGTFGALLKTGSQGSILLLLRKIQPDLNYWYGKGIRTISNGGEIGKHIAYKVKISSKFQIALLLDEANSITTNNQNDYLKRKRIYKGKGIYNWSKYNSLGVSFVQSTNWIPASPQTFPIQNNRNTLSLETHLKGANKTNFHFIIRQTMAKTLAKEYGSFIGARIKRNTFFGRWSFAVHYFNNSAYGARTYLTESNLYPFRSTILYNGSGFRSYFFMNYKIKYFDLGFKTDALWLFNQETIGSGYDKIDSNVKNNLTVQIKVKL